jgi:signal transduction histidine kinase
MSGLRSRIWKRILSAPSVLFPASVAAVSGLVAVFTGGVWIWVAAVAAGVAVAVVATKLAAGVESLEETALQEETEERSQREEAQFEELQRKLRSDRDHRTKDCLVTAREARKEFMELAKRDGLAHRTLEIGKQFDQLFWATIEQLEHSLKLYDLADRLVDKRRDEILREREVVVSDLLSSADRLRQVTTQLRQISQEEREVDLKPLTDELDASLRIAKRVDERLKELENGPNHDEFLKQ